MGFIQGIISAFGLDNVVGNFLAATVSAVLLALVFYTVVAVKDDALITAVLNRGMMSSKGSLSGY
jgi:hypothetical protein